MAVEVERLLVSLEGRITQFERSFDRAAAVSRGRTVQIERDADRMAARVQASFAKAGAGASAAFKASFAGIAAGAIGAISIDGVTKSIADLAKLQDVADRTGVSTKQIQELGFAVEQSGGEIADVQSGLTKFAVNLSKAGQGGGDLSKILEANNVALKDQAGALRPVGDLLGDVAELIKNASSEGDQLNIATAAFGRSAGPALVQALAGGRAGLADFAAKAQAAGVVLDEKVTRKAADLDDQIVKLTRQVSTLGKQLVVEFGGPAISAALEATLAKLREMQGVIDALRNVDLGKLGEFALSRTGPGALYGYLNGRPAPADDPDKLGGQAAEIRAEIEKLRNLPMGVLPAGQADQKIEKLKRDLAEIEARIKRINANALDFVPSRAGYTDGSTPLEQIDVQGKPTILPSEGGGGSNPLGDGDAIATYVRQVVKAESGGNASAKNPNSTATGAGQFIESTWLALFRKNFPEAARGMGESAILALRNDADISKRLIEDYAKENAASLRASGLAVTSANLHLAHFLGPQGAIKALTANPQANAADVLGSGVVNANRAVFRPTGTVQDVLDYSARRANQTRLAAGDLTPSEEKTRDAGKRYDDALNESDARTAALGRESEALNQNAYAKAFAAEKARLLADVEKEGGVASPEQIAAIDGKAAAYARQSDALDRLETASKAVKQAQQEMGEIGADATKTFVSELRAGASAADALRSALDRVVDRLLDGLIDSVFKGLFSGATGGGGLLGSLFGGARAAGGPVAADKAYLVGEKGPELFAPGRSGTVVPNGVLARARMPAVPQARAAINRISPQVTMKIDLRGANGDATIRRIAGEAAAAAGRQAYSAAVATSDQRVARNQSRATRLGHV